MSKYFRNQLGFTAIEVLMVMIIVAVLAAVGIPSYRELVQNMRAVTLSTDFNTALAYARSEAVKRGEFVTICPAANATFNACGNNANWTNGWIVFVDPNDDGTIASPNDRLRTQDALQQGTTFNTTQNRITYASTGFLTAGAGTYTMSAPDCIGTHGRLVTITNTGRANVADIAC